MATPSASLCVRPLGSFYRVPSPPRLASVVHTRCDGLSAEYPTLPPQVPRPTEGDPAVERMRALIRRNAVAKRDAAASRSPGDRQTPMGRDERSTLLSRAKVGVKSRDRRGSNKPRRGAGKSGVWGSKSYKGAATRLLNHPYFEVSILFLTIWALFAEDVRLAAFSRPTSEQADVGFWGARRGSSLRPSTF